MRLNPNAGSRHLALADDPRAPLIGIADAVALAAAHGPGALPQGFARAVLRLAFGRSAGTDAHPAAPAGASPVEQGRPRLVRAPRPLLRREARTPRCAARENAAATNRGIAAGLTLLPRSE